jgi:hypothetical protein
MVRLHRLWPGQYHYNGYVVERIGNSWRWYDPNNLHRGGEWRSTKREAALDLLAFLGK